MCCKQQPMDKCGLQLYICAIVVGSASSSSLYTDMLPFMCKILHPRELSGGQKLDLAEVSSFGRAHGYTT